MAETSELSDKIDHNLRVVRGKVGSLPRVQHWWTAPEDAVLAEQRRADRADWDLEWGDVIDRWAWLDKMYRKAAMSADQAAQYEALLCLLSNVLPIMKRLRLELPPTAVLTRAATAWVAPVTSRTARG